MKKIALVTNWDYHDYGGMLQAYATQQALCKLGVESEVIDFDNLKSDINKRKWIYFFSNIFDVSIVKEKGRIFFKKLKTKYDKGFAEKQRLRDDAFDVFSKRRFKVSQRFESWDDLSINCKQYDAVVVGSDQLWLPSNVAGDYYTLNFVPDNIKKVAYATSFGVGSVPVKMKKKYVSFLNRIDNLSARETSGQAIIKQCTGRDVPLVCDPTMLLEKEDWNRILNDKRIIEGDYIFCYFMGDNPEQREFVKRLAKKENCRIVALLHLDQFIASDENYVDDSPYDINPSEFVNLVKNARYVCTDSFHGTVFSILFSKDFFTFKRFNKKASLSTNSRLTSLLNRLNLENRLIVGNEPMDDILHIKNYEDIQKQLSEFRSFSFHYLKNSLEL